MHFDMESDELVQDDKDLDSAMIYDAMQTIKHSVSEALSQTDVTEDWEVIEQLIIIGRAALGVCNIIDYGSLKGN
jgi:hypothetical protein